MLRVGKWSRRTLAGLAMACFFLPLAECSHTAVVPPEATAAPSLPTPATPRVTSGRTREVFIAVSAVPPAEIGFWFWLVVFAWPLLALRLAARLRRPLAQGILHGSELMLGAASLYLVGEVIHLWGSVRYGGILALTAFAGLTIVAFSDFVVCVRTLRGSHS